MMGARARSPVASVESGVGRIRVVHVDGRAEVEMGQFRGQHACMRYSESEQD